jgi:hypothetical protein
MNNEYNRIKPLINDYNLNHMINKYTITILESIIISLMMDFQADDFFTKKTPVCNSL